MDMKNTCKTVKRTMTDASGRVYNLILTDRNVDKDLELEVKCDDDHAYHEPSGPGGIVVGLHIRKAPRYVLEQLITEMKDMLDNL